MKKIFSIILLCSNIMAFPLVDNIRHTVNHVRTIKDDYSGVVYNKLTVDQYSKKLVTTILNLSSEVELLTIKYAETFDMKYKYMLCILEEIKDMFISLNRLIVNRKNYTFPQFIDEFTKIGSLDDNIANEFNLLLVLFDPEEYLCMGIIIHELEGMKNINDRELMNLLKKIWKN